MKSWIKFSVSLLFLIILCSLYFLRDFVFVNANGHIEWLRITYENEYANQITNYTHSTMIGFFGDWSISTIVLFKWIMTLVFTIIFGLISWAGMSLLQNRKVALWGLLFYAVAFTLALIIYLFAYPVSRQIIGLLHSPVPFMLLLVTAQLKNLMDKDYG